MTGPKLHRGRLAKPPRIISVRPLTREDLAVLKETRVTPRVKNLRAQHHRLAYMLASGMTTKEASDVTGYSVTRILQLKADPAFRQLMSEFEPEAKATARQVVDEYARSSFENTMMAQEILGEHLARCVERIDDPESELIPIKYLLPITHDYGDRFGYGKHTSQTTKVVDFAKVMEQAQVYRGTGTVIDAPSRRLQGGGSKPVGSSATIPGPQAELVASPGIRRRL